MKASPFAILGRTIANHIRKFWEPRMRNAGLDPTVREAIETLRQIAAAQ
jgi:NADH-dependant formate dehydrogenase delta subunit FdsD